MINLAPWSLLEPINASHSTNLLFMLCEHHRVFTDGLAPLLSV